jgi:selenocysteine lyase/cysteine desulfurase
LDLNDEAALRRAFPILDALIFFNHAGVAPLSGPAAAALRDYVEQASRRAYVNADWYPQAHAVKTLAARLIGAAGPQEIAFIPNTSTGLSLVAKGIRWVQGDNVVITDVEYPANRYPWQDLARFGVEIIEVPQQDHGVIDAQQVAEAVTDRTRLVSVSHVQYASGCRLDLKPISAMVHQAGGYLCVDGIQSVGALPVDVEAMGIDFLAADGHKWLLGPEGCGIFYVREDLAPLLHPNVVGWMNMVEALDFGHYRFEFQMDARRFEPGSYNIPGVLALGASLQMFLDIGIENVWARIEALTDRLCKGLKAKGYHLFSPRKPGQRSGIVTFTPPTRQGASPVRKIADDLQARDIIIVVREGRLRASPHFYNTPQQIDALIEALP